MPISGIHIVLLFSGRKSNTLTDEQKVVALHIMHERRGGGVLYKQKQQREQIMFLDNFTCIELLHVVSFSISYMNFIY